MPVTLRLGLPDAQRAAAAAIYWQAFGAKLGRVMGPQAKAQAYLMAVMQADHVLAALAPDGQLLGVAGFKTPQGAFADGDYTDLRRAYGTAGAAWRRTALRLLNSTVDNERFLVDGICVAQDARGQGIGSALLRGLFDQGARRGYAAIRLDVVASNSRARALYERHGFIAVATETIGPLRHIFGFDAATTMVRDLTQADLIAGPIATVD